MKRRPVVASSAASISAPSQRRSQRRNPEPIGRPNPAPAQLAGRRVESVERDPLSVLVKCHYDPHEGPPQAPRSDTCADHPRLS
jgi:hypothetical protein